MSVNEIHKARRMLKAIYRLADQPSATTLSDIRFFARAGVIQLNHMLDQAGQEDKTSRASPRKAPHDSRQPAGMSFSY